MASNENVFGVETYYSLWAQSVASTLSQFTGKELGAEMAAAGEEAEGERFWVTFTMSDTLLGEQAFSVSKADALHLGQLFIGETTDPNAEFTPDHADALAELFRQFAGTVALQLKGILGAECPVRFKDTTMPSWSSAETTALVVNAEPQITIILKMDTGLLNSVTKIVVPSEETETQPEPVAAAAAPAVQEQTQPRAAAPQPQPATIPDDGPSQSSGAPLTDRNLDLLLDVELEVSIRFGRKQMLLKDVLELSSGAMVELDRRVRDPIELLLGGRVIARGEAVIVDGNYGIRITEIMSPSQRLAEIA